MSAIGKGDWVECVDASPGWYGLPSGLAVGAVYQIAKVVVPGVFWLAQVDHGSPYSGFRAERFRPIYRPKANAFDHLLKPVDVRVGA